MKFYKTSAKELRVQTSKGLAQEEVRSIGGARTGVGTVIVLRTGKDTCTMKTISQEKLQERLKGNKTNLIEVLPEEDYKREHIQGAENIPLKRIATEAKKKFEHGDELIVYCSDSECSSSTIAARKLENLGFTNVYHYKGGKKEWREAGLPMA